MSVLESVELVTRILDLLAASSVPLGVTEVAQALGEGKSRIHRNLVSLKHFGYVTQNQVSDKYALGWKLFQLGEKASLESNIRQVAAPYLKYLSSRTHLGAMLAVPINGTPLVVDSVANEGFVSISVKPGNKPLPLKSAQGRVALAYASRAQFDEILRLHLPGLAGEKVDAAWHTRLDKRLAAIRENLYETAPNETLIGINVLSAPVLRGPDELVAIVSVVGSIQHLADPPGPAVRDAVLGVAAALSRFMGSTVYEARGIPALAISSEPPA
ncbi:IclR family transcriptional regulator [Ramlibacter sp. MAHUQ-53]|uniref:IclR family transcriptional regulator n=1 Tax=unclassified Ramlibacter TaxID=2617605 RepID=UPI00363E60C2